MDKLRCAFISDIHLGATEISTEKMIEELNLHYSNSTVFSKINCTVLGGDIFDKLLKTNSLEWSQIQRWAHRVLDLACIHNVTVRVLHGTPSHDDNQTQLFEDIALSLIAQGRVLDFSYVNKLSIEKNERFNMHWLFIPDECNNDTATTFTQVNELLRQNGIKQLDYIFAHGQFDYQLPDVVKPHLCHKLEDYKQVCKKAMFIGHIHMQSNNDYVYAPGSFSRTRHGEPKAKGYYIFEDTSTGLDTTFVINESVTQFVQFNIKDLNSQEAIEYVNEKTKKLPIGSRIKLVVSKTSELLKNAKEFNIHFPNFKITVETKDKTAKDKRTIELPQFNNTSILINENTINDLLLARMISTGVDKTVAEQAVGLLKRINI